MEAELLRQLVHDPGRWPYYLAFAAVIWFIFKFVGALAEALWSRIAKTFGDNTRLLRVCTIAAQILVITVAVYFFNLFFWSSHLANTINSPEVISSRLTMTDKGFLLMSSEASDPELYRRAKAATAFARMSDIARMKPADTARLIEHSHQNLIRLGLIEDLPVEMGPHNAIGYPAQVTPLGKRVLRYMIDNDML